MKTVFLIGLLAVSAAAFSDSAPSAEDPSSIIQQRTLENNEITDEPDKSFTLPYDEREILDELVEFGRQMTAYPLNLKTYACSLSRCLPFSLPLDTVQALVIKSLLKQIYGTEFDRLVKESQGDIVSKWQAKFSSGLYDILAIWDETLAALGNVPSSLLLNKGIHEHLSNIYLSVFDGEEAYRRFLHVFGPGLNKTATDETISNAIRYVDNSAFLDSSNHMYTSFNNHRGINKHLLVQKIHRFIRRMYTYVFQLDNHGKDHVWFIERALKELPIQSLLVFDFYLQNVFGKAMMEIGEVLSSTVEQRREKIEIVDSLKQMMNTTLSAWNEDFSILMDSDNFERTRSDSSMYFYRFAEYADALADFLAVEDLRLVLQKATPILGLAKKGIIIPEPSDPYK